MSVRLPRHSALVAFTCVSALLLPSRPALAQLSQQSPKLLASDSVGPPNQGYAVALSADGNTAIVGGRSDNANAGAAWIWVRDGAGNWTQQGTKLVGTGASATARQGTSVALSADGNTAIVGGPAQSANLGAVWIFTRNGLVWTQQAGPLVGAGAVGAAQQGTSVTLSADGNTAVIGGPSDAGNTGAAWVLIRTGGTWSQQGSKLVGTGAVGSAQQGVAVDLSGDGNTVMIGGSNDAGTTGAAWVFTRDSSLVWSQQGSKLVASDSTPAAGQGTSVSLSGDGNTAIVGAPGNDGNIGAAWAWIRSGGVWTQQGPKMVGLGAIGSATQGRSVSVSSDGNTAIVGGDLDNGSFGAAWMWARGGGVWSQRGDKLVANDFTSLPRQGFAVALSADGKTAFIGGPDDDANFGASWAWVASAPTITTQPQSLTVAPGDTATFTAAASGNPTPTVQWQVSTNGGSTFFDISGATSPTYSFVATTSDSGKQFRAVFTNSAGTATTNAATLLVTGSLAITSNPSNQTVPVGGTATFTASASGAPTPTVQWQVSSDGGSSFSDISGATSTTYAFTVAAADNGKQFRAVFSNANGSATTTAATLTVTGAPAIVTQPTNQTVAAGGTATFTAAATGNPTPTVRWQVSTNGGTSFSDIAGATSTTYSFTATTADNGKQFRAVFTNSGGSATTSAATLTVTIPRMFLDRTQLRFAAVTTGTSFSSRTGAQTVRLSQSGGGGISWTASSTVPWLVVSPASGTGPAVLSISVQFAAGLTDVQTGRINVTLTGSSSTVGPINVTLTTVSSSAPPSLPFGNFDTPAGDATVLSGSVAVTGWTLDNIGVQRVELWRDLQPGETTTPFAGPPSDPRNGKVFIANASFVDGARPDVEGLFPATPANYRAGWGYLMLTWGLVNQGNGTYKLYAFAFDQENNLATIGSKTIVVNNNAATKPFGSIDTPAIGGDASGPNYGWALTPKVNGAATCKIQSNGVQVSIDSGPLQPVVYGDVRPDIASAFSGFSNSAAAGGHYIFDWSTLSNGVHTISWAVTDDCNRADGIGSRFFTVSTGTSLVAGVTPAAAASVAAQSESPEVVTVARGFGELPEVVSPDAAGSRTVAIKQGERIEVRLPRGFESAVQVVNGGQGRELPLGASWDESTGIFSWQPAAGFLGRYRIVFSNGAERISLRVIVTP